MKRFFKILAIAVVVLIAIVFCLRTFFGGNLELHLPVPS